MSRQLLLLLSIVLLCTGVVIAPAHSEESTEDRQGIPEKVVPGGTYFR